MAYKTFAAIDVGSTDVTMKIFEVTAKKGYRQLDYVSNIIDWVQTPMRMDIFHRNRLRNYVIY